jgi:hypothetical protein
MVAVEMLSMMKYDEKFEKLQVSSETLFKTSNGGSFYPNLFVFYLH